MAKFRKPIPLQFKIFFLSFEGTKSRWKEKLRLQTTIILEIINALCLSVNWVPKLIQKSCQIMEKKLVLHCETKVVVNACNAPFDLRHIVVQIILYIYPRINKKHCEFDLKPEPRT